MDWTAVNSVEQEYKGKPCFITQQELIFRLNVLCKMDPYKEGKMGGELQNNKKVTYLEMA